MINKTAFVLVTAVGIFCFTLVVSTDLGLASCYGVVFLILFGAIAKATDE